jgi:hypothetical protein
MTSPALPEQVSEHLAPENILSLVRALPSVLPDLIGDSQLIARYGAGCNIHADLWLVPMRVGVSWLASFLESTIAQQIFQPGDSELRLDLENERLKISFCNEGHLHLGGSDTPLRNTFLSKCPFNTIHMVGWSDGV